MRATIAAVILSAAAATLEYRSDAPVLRDRLQARLRLSRRAQVPSRLPTLRTGVNPDDAERRQDAHLGLGPMGQHQSVFRSQPDTGCSAWTSSGPYANLVHDALMDWSADEPASIYGRLAEGIAVADDGAWIAFRIRDGRALARTARPVTIDDVHFTFTAHSLPRHPRRSPPPLNPIESFEVIGPREIRFHIRKGQRGDPLLPIVIRLEADPSRHISGRTGTSARPASPPPLGSGPYRVKELRVGRWIPLRARRGLLGAGPAGHARAATTSTR